MFRHGLTLRKVVDHNSKEGVDYITQRMKYTRYTNLLMYFFLISPVAYVPFHLYLNHGSLWGGHDDPYAIEGGKSETLREKRLREAAEAIKRAEGASEPTDVTSNITATSTSPPSKAGGNSLWLRGGTFKESLDVKPKA